MCGLYGFIGDPSRYTSTVIRNLGIANERRGKDSSGLAYWTGNKFSVTRGVQPSSRFLNRKRSREAISSSAVIGHTRYATHGDINWKNSHPFRFGKWIFAHNGVISNFAELNYMLNKNYKVDSQVIGDLLPNRMDLLEGSYAIVAFNIDEPDKIYFWRRFSPLFVAVSDRACFFSSIGPSLFNNLSGFDIREAPNGSYGVIEKGRMSFDIRPIASPIILNNFWLMGPDEKGAYHATSNFNSEEAIFERFARSCPR